MPWTDHEIALDRRPARPPGCFDATVSQPQFTIDRSTLPLSSPNWSSAVPVVAPVSYDVIWRNAGSERIENHLGS